MPKLTKTAVDAAKAADKRLTLWDTEIPGFGLLVLPSGVKSYIYQYRNAHGISRRITIGRHGALTTEEARTAARKEAAAVIVDRRDVVAERKAKRDAKTVGEMIDAYLASAKFAGKAGSTQDVDKGRIERHLRPLLGSKVLETLKPEDVRRLFADIAAGKTKTPNSKKRPRGRNDVVKGGEGTARAAVRLLRAMLTWAIQEGIADTNPARGLNIGRDGVRDVLLTGEQYQAMFAALAALEDEKKLRREAADAIRVLALTGARRGEVIGMQWKHVDLKTGIVTLPPNRHKTGAKTGAPRLIALPAAAQAIIARQEKGGPDDLVFPPARPGIMNLTKLWYLVRDAAGLPKHVTLHGLRHALASTMAVQGAQAAEIMTALGHRELATAQRYIHFAQDARVALLEKHTAGITAAMNGDAKKADVADIEKARGNG